VHANIITQNLCIYCWRLIGWLFEISRACLYDYIWDSESLARVEYGGCAGALIEVKRTPLMYKWVCFKCICMQVPYATNIANIFTGCIIWFLLLTAWHPRDTYWYLHFWWKKFFFSVARCKQINVFKVIPDSCYIPLMLSVIIMGDFSLLI
jgi:hypothetical protein